MPIPLDRKPSLAERAAAAAAGFQKDLAHIRKHGGAFKGAISNKVASEADILKQDHNTSELLQKLPTCKRMSYDQAFIDLVNNTRSIDAEEIIGQLDRACFPFDTIWLEGANPSPLPGTRFETGFLVSANANEHSFSFLAMHADGEPASTFASSVRPHVSKELGIDLHDDELFAEMEKLSELVGHNVAVSRIESYYQTAEFLARAFVILGSQYIASNFSNPKSTKELEQEANNRARKRMGKALSLPTIPIEIDVTKINPRFFEKIGTKELRQLLGWTSVRRSKPIQRKDGSFYTRSPHDRRIAAPVDRRNVERHLTASRPESTLTVVSGSTPALGKSEGPQ